jgi:hypothetical protein
MSQLGRPRANQKKKTILHGVTTPSKENYILELDYGAALDIKKVFGVISACNKREVYFVFTPEYLVMTSEDHNKKVKISPIILGSNCIRYYCQEQIALSASSIDIAASCKIVNKDFGNIRLYMKRGDKSNLHIVLREKKFGSDDKLSVPVSIMSIGPPNDCMRCPLEIYDLGFKINSGHFKRRLTNYSSSITNKACYCEVSYTKGKIPKFLYKNSDMIPLTNRTKYRDIDTLNLKIREEKERISCIYNLGHVSDIFKTITSVDFHILLSDEKGLCMIFFLEPVEDHRLNTKYLYKSSLTEDKNSIIVRVFFSKNV